MTVMRWGAHCSPCFEDFTHATGFCEIFASKTLLCFIYGSQSLHCWGCTYVTCPLYNYVHVLEVNLVHSHLIINPTQLVIFNALQLPNCRWVFQKFCKTLQKHWGSSVILKAISRLYYCYIPVNAISCIVYSQSHYNMSAVAELTH